MTVFITKVWGFGEPSGPLQFSKRGWRDRALKDLRPGDLVALVGTEDEPTSEDERGRVLGLMEPTAERVMSLDFDLRCAPHDFDEDGEYRWPFALHNRAAWTIEPDNRLRLKQISDRSFSMDAVLGIVPLTDDEARSVLALRRRPVEMLAPTAGARLRLGGSDGARRRSAPPPATTRAGVMHMRRASAFTYCMELEGADGPAFKVGWAFDTAARERQFNQASMPGLGGIRYRTRLRHLWDTAREAFAMEQALLRRFDCARHRANREVIDGVPLAEVESAWADALLWIRRRAA